MPTETDTNASEHSTTEHSTTPPILIGAAWALVMIPLAWGLISTLSKALLLFG